MQKLSKLPISALILAKNEQDMIEGCLKQLNFVDEIIVLNQSSQDNTANIARRYDAKILDSKIEDFAHNRNILAKAAKNNWLLYLDCDERLTDVNIKEIEESMKDNSFSVYYFPRKNFILGHFSKHGGWWPDYVPRLFKAADLVAWEGEVHESPKIKDKIGYMHNPIIHYTARTISLMLTKTIKWAEIEANLRFQAGQKEVKIANIAKTMTFEFINRYFAKLGFLDGRFGLIQSLFQALHQAAVLTYLWEKQHNFSKKEFYA